MLAPVEHDILEERFFKLTAACAGFSARTPFHALHKPAFGVPLFLFSFNGLRLIHELMP
jgi:hypothetical protein